MNEVVLHRAQKIAGWMSDAELFFLAEVAKNSKNILEVGVFKGRTTRVLADNTEGRVISIDPWNGNYQSHLGVTHYNGGNTEFSQFICYLNDHLESGKVKYIADLFHNLNFEENFDFIFIDALHDYKSVRRDILHSLLFLKNGILAGHDYGTVWDGVKRAVDEIFENVNIIGTIWWVRL